MNQMDGMGRIESAQTELCQFLMSMIPVEWTKICFYGDVTNGGRSTSAWISLVEKKTGLICTQGAFWRRYEKYPYKTAYAMDKLCDLVDALWDAYVERFGVEKTWCAYYLTINEDYTFHVDLGYELLGDDKSSRTDAVFEKFYNRKYTDCWYEYPFDNIQGASLSIFRYLIKVIPVEWSRICFMGEVKYGSGEISTWMALVEKKTGAICPQESFWQRYASYPIAEAEVNQQLSKLTRNLHQMHVDESGENRLLRTYFLSLTSDKYELKSSRGMEFPNTDQTAIRNSVYKHFFNSEYKLLDGKYPY